MPQHLNPMVVAGDRGSTTNARVRSRLSLLAAAALVTACSSDPELPTVAASPSAAHAAHARMNNGDLTAAQKEAIAEVRNATARFHDLAVA